MAYACEAEVRATLDGARIAPGADAALDDARGLPRADAIALLRGYVRGFGAASASGPGMVAGSGPGLDSASATSRA